MKVYKSLPRITIASYPSPSILDSIKGRKKYAYKDLLLRESSKITQTMLVKGTAVGTSRNSNGHHGTAQYKIFGSQQLTLFTRT